MSKFFKEHKFHIFIFLFFFFNMGNAMLTTTSLLNNLLSPYKRDVFMVINAFIGDLAFLSVLLGLGFIVFKKERARSKYLIVITFLLAFFCYGMSNYIPVYGMMPSFWNIKAFGDGGGSEAVEFAIAALTLIVSQGKTLFLLPAVLFLIIYFVMLRKSYLLIDKNSSYPFFKRLSAGTMILATGLIFSNFSYHNYVTVNKGTWFEENATSIYGTQSLGLYNFYVYEGLEFTSLELKLKKPSINFREEIELQLKKYQSECQINPIDGKEYCNTTKNFGLFEGKNLILIQVESLNNFAVGLKVKIGDEYLEVTPNINRILDSSVYFNNFYTAVGIGNTSDAEFATMTGLYPSGPKYTVYEYDNVEYPTLARTFEEEDYYSFSIHANSGVFYNRKYIHENIYGFSDYFGEEELEELGLIDRESFVHSWLGDKELLEATANIIKQHNDLGEKVFSFPITVSTHLPYGYDKNLYKDIDPLFPNDYNHLDSFTLGYLQHLYYTDYAIGNMLSLLEELGILDNTIVAFYGDHGSTINFSKTMEDKPELFKNDINGIYGKDYAVNEKDAISKRRFEQNIPFIIYDKSKTLEKQTISYSRGQTDIFRTLANLFGIKQQYYFGNDAFIDAATFVFSPRTEDIFVGDMAISASSRKYFNAYPPVEYDSDLRNQIIDEYRKYKDFNARLLEYELFPKIIK